MRAFYTRVVVRIAERESISCRKAVNLYQRALFLNIKDFSKGLTERVANKVRKSK